jgi:ketosteroid isomerase-like protein
MSAKDTMRNYFETWNARDFDAFEAQLAGDATFVGPLGTANGAGELRRGIQGLSKLVERAEVVAMVGEGDDVITWFELHTPAGERLPVANWAQVRDGRVQRVRVTFDPRPLLG